MSKHDHACGAHSTISLFRWPGPGHQSLLMFISLSDQVESPWELVRPDHPLILCCPGSQVFEGLSIGDHNPPEGWKSNWEISTFQRTMLLSVKKIKLKGSQT